MKKIVIAGGSGFLGSVLINYFQDKEAQIYVLSRKDRPSEKTISFIRWDAKSKGAWTAVLENADVLINLTGKSVDCRYNETNKNLILTSRIESTKLLGEAIQDCVHPPKVWLNSSTATIYRHSLDKGMDEFDGEIGKGFSVGVAKAWEKAFFSFRLPLTRQVALRTSIVLGRNGGAFVPIQKMTALGFGGKQGPGNQMVSWIHEDDFARSIEFLIQNKNTNGIVNIVAPNPITNKHFMSVIRKKIQMPFGIPMGKPLLQFGARLIGTETELILKSRFVVPKRLIDLGFTFKFHTIEEAVKNLITN